jgi:hypothetical protein
MSLAYSCTDSKTGVEMNPENLSNLSITDPQATAMGQPSIPISGFAICVSARIASGDRKIDLVQHTPKRDKGPQIIPTPRVIPNGGNPHQPFASSGPSSVNTGIATFERMQFKTATANNGKRRAAQQFYAITIELYAVSAWDGSFILAGYSESNCLVVRGRSPGHYVDGGGVMSPSLRQSSTGYEGSPQTPMSSFNSPMTAMSYQVTTPQMSESVLPMTGSLLTNSESDVFVLSQHSTPGMVDVGTFSNYSPDYLTQNLWADSAALGVGTPGDGMSYDLGFNGAKGMGYGISGMPLSPPKSSSLFYDSGGF